MRITAEIIQELNTLLVRLLGPGILMGNYSIDGTPELPGIQQFDITADSIINDEVDLRFTGYYPLPKKLTVTLPNLTTVVVDLVLNSPNGPVLHHDPRLLGKQSNEILAPYEPPAHQPGEAATVTRATEVQSKPSVPTFWVDLNFESSAPLKLGPGVLSAALTYVGGGAGRALDSTHPQPAANMASWLFSAPTRLEGSFSNLLQQSNFYPTRSVAGFFDEIPTGWDIALSDTASLLRIKSQSGGISLSFMELTWTPAPETQMAVPSPTVTIQSPPVPANTYFQIIVAPGADNEPGEIQLKTQDGLVASPVISLEYAQVIRLNVGSHPGRVKILWTQNSEGGQQLISLLAPIVSAYESAHSWIPYSITSTADVVTAGDVSYPAALTWPLDYGSVRVESVVEESAKPFSWSIRSDAAGTPLILGLREGRLYSDYTTSAPYLLASALPLSASKAGSYKIKWKTATEFRVVSDIPNQAPEGVLIPFGFDLPIPSSVLGSSVTLKLESYAVNSGTALVKLFRFSPK